MYGLDLDDVQLFEQRERVQQTVSLRDKRRATNRALHPRGAGRLLVVGRLSSLHF